MNATETDFHFFKRGLDEFKRGSNSCRALSQHRGSFRRLPGADHGHASFDYSRLFPSNFWQGAPKPPHMVQRNRSDDRNDGNHRIGGIQRASHASFQHDQFATFLREMVQSERRRDFEECRRMIPVG